jgi:hypothetical protein
MCVFKPVGAAHSPVLQCDGQRPVCSRCIKRGVINCSYDTGGESRLQALKKKHLSLEEENAQLKELYSLLRERKEDDAWEIFKRIRNTEDPLAILQFVKEADILLSDLPTSQPSSGTSLGTSLEPSSGPSSGTCSGTPSGSSFQKPTAEVLPES